jgi:hypothetical protein
VAWDFGANYCQKNHTPEFRRNPRAKSREHHHATNVVAWAHDKLGFIADTKQAEVLSSSTNRGILNCCRQWGKSTTTAIKAVHHALFNPDSVVLVASPSLRQSGEFLKKSEKALRQLGLRVRGDGSNQCSLLLPNGSRIVGLPEREGTIRGFSAVSLLIVDEASRVSDELYQALRPMIAVSRGALWLMSTPSGKSGFFYREWASQKDWVRIQASADECPRIPAEFLMEERETLSDDMFRQEYNCEFLSGEGALFDESEIRARLSGRVAPLW